MAGMSNHATPSPVGPGNDAAHRADLHAPGRVFVRTVRVEEDVDLTAHLPAAASAIWLRHGQGLVALGEVWSVSTDGPERFADASAAFRDLAAQAQVHDDVRTRMSGLVALGTFSYTAASPRPSRLLVPRAILGVEDGEAFLTVISRGQEPELPASWRDLFTATPSSAAAEVDVDPDHTPDEYQGLVRQAVAAITAGQAQKVVLSERSTVHVPQGVEPSAVAARLAHLYPSCWTYRMGDVLGASPEMLAQTERGRLFSRVLAGTRAAAEVGGLTEEDRRLFRSDPKEREEHDYAVRSVVDRLVDLADHIEASEEPFVLRLPGLEHLASDVTAHLSSGVTSLDVAARLHPSAAVSGTPRERADEIIAALEPHDRGGYAAPVGWMNASGDGQWAIALRMAHLVDQHTVRVQAGGGLVAASDAVAEHAEALAKTRPMLRALRGDDA